MSTPLSVRRVLLHVVLAACALAARGCAVWCRRLQSLSEEIREVRKDAFAAAGEREGLATPKVMAEEEFEEVL